MSGTINDFQQGARTRSEALTAVFVLASSTLTALPLTSVASAYHTQVAEKTIHLPHHLILLQGTDKDFQIMQPSSPTDSSRPMTIDPDAEHLVNRYNLSSTLARVKDAIYAQHETSVIVRQVMVSADREWSQDKPRVLITIGFEADLLAAYDAWKQVYPTVQLISAAAEAGETMVFEFAGLLG